MRINRLKQGLRETRKFRIQFQVDARSQERKALEQPFDIRVGADILGISVQGQSAGDLGKLPCANSAAISRTWRSSLL